MSIKSFWQLYRIYKNETPIPLERYVMNFMFDVPLPPCGDTRVQYTLADETVYSTSSAELGTQVVLDRAAKSGSSAWPQTHPRLGPGRLWQDHVGRRMGA